MFPEWVGAHFTRIADDDLQSQEFTAEALVMKVSHELGVEVFSRVLDVRKAPGNAPIGLYSVDLRGGQKALRVHHLSPGRWRHSGVLDQPND